MRAKIVYKKGEKIGLGMLTYNKEAKPNITPLGKRERMATFDCECGGKITRVIQQVKKNNVKSCGCLHVGYYDRDRRMKNYENVKSINGVTIIKSLGVFNHNQKALAICPTCSKDWEIDFWKIKSGNVKSCCKSGLDKIKENQIKKFKEKYFYKLRFSNQEEVFFKFGVTNNIKQRVKEIKCSSKHKYDIEIVSCENMDTREAYNKEDSIIKNSKKYIPKHKFRGHTECVK